MIETIMLLASVNLTSQAQIEDWIIARAMVHETSPKRALAIARAESGLNPNAKNASSTASGLYQFINGTFKGYCIDKYHLTDSMSEKNNPVVQIECATRMFSEGGSTHWFASAPVWKKVIYE